MQPRSMLLGVHACHDRLRAAIRQSREDLWVSTTQRAQINTFSGISSCPHAPHAEVGQGPRLSRRPGPGEGLPSARRQNTPPESPFCLWKSRLREAVHELNQVVELRAECCNRNIQRSSGKMARCPTPGECLAAFGPMRFRFRWFLCFRLKSWDFWVAGTLSTPSMLNGTKEHQDKSLYCCCC